MVLRNLSIPDTVQLQRYQGNVVCLLATVTSEVFAQPMLRVNVMLLMLFMAISGTSRCGQAVCKW